MKQLSLLLFACSLMGVACSQSFYYRPAPEQPNQTTLIYNQGVPSLRALLPHVEVSTDLTSQGQSMLNLGVFVRNDGDSLVTFLPEDVHVTGFNAAGEGKRYRVFSAEQFIRRRNRQNVIIAGAIVVATVATVVAVNQEVNTSSNTDWSNNNHYSDDWWWWAWSTPAIYINTEGTPPPPYASTDGLLRTQTLYQGESIQGLIKVKSDPNFRDKILVEVPVNGSYAKFVFGRQERRF